MIANNVSIDIGENTTSLIEKLAQQLGMTVEQIYPYYIKQAWLEGILPTCASGFLMVVWFIVVGSIFGSSYLDWKEKGVYEGELLVGTGIVGTIVFLVISMWMVSAITRFLNPEYHAIQEIIHAISTLTP
jgi:hypothetical protein